MASGARASAAAQPPTRVGMGYVAGLPAERQVLVLPEHRLAALTLRQRPQQQSLERDFDAVPELAALVADLEEEIEALVERIASLYQQLPNALLPALSSALGAGRAADARDPAALTGKKNS